MLSLGPGSTCDVCLEFFGIEIKAPCAIQCGHVFCIDCLNHITRPQCPLCRIPFDSRFSIRLHIDLDNVHKDSPKNKSGSSSSNSNSGVTEQEAKKLQEAIVKVANEGSGELQARQLIGDCKSFLSHQPRELFVELRVAHRMLEYLCDVKSRLLSQTHEVAILREELDRLKEEKAGLQARIRDVLESQKFERETAYAVESSLREHCARSHEAYVTVVEQYNFVVSEWIRLREEIQHLRSPSVPSPPLDPTHPRDRSTRDAHFNATSRTPQPRSIPNLDQDRLDGAAIRIADTYLISPLPELTTFIDRPIALPTEKEIAAATYVQEKLSEDIILPIDSDPSIPATEERECGKAGHPYTCDCEDINIFSPDQKKSDIKRATFDVEPPLSPAAVAAAVPLATPVVDVHVKAKVSQYTPNMNLSSSIPSTPSARGRSYTVPSHHGSRAPSRAAAAAATTTTINTNTSPRPLSPIGNIIFASHSQTPTNPTPREIYSPGHAGTTSSSTSTSGTFPQNHRESESVRSRLHDLLQDSTTTPSACSTPAPAPMPPAPYSSSSSSSSTSNNNNMSSGLSRASSAALALEKERKERKKAEKEQRRLEKERQRTEQEDLPIPRPTSTSTVHSGVYSRSTSSSYSRESNSPYPTHSSSSQRHRHTSSSNPKGSFPTVPGLRS